MAPYIMMDCDGHVTQCTMALSPSVCIHMSQLYSWLIWHSCYSASVTHKKTQNTSSAWSDWLRHWYGRGICLHITESVDERVERAVLPWGRLSLYVAMSLQGWSCDSLVMSKSSIESCVLYSCMAHHTVNGMTLQMTLCTLAPSPAVCIHDLSQIHIPKSSRERYVLYPDMAADIVWTGQGTWHTAQSLPNTPLTRMQGSFMVDKKTDWNIPPTIFSSGAVFLSLVPASPWLHSLWLSHKLWLHHWLLLR